jgi:hypothetical protein
MGGGGSGKGGSHRNSTIHDNDNSRRGIKSQRSTNNQRVHQKNNQMTNMHKNRIKWLKGTSLSRVGMPRPRGD